MFKQDKIKIIHWNIANHDNEELIDEAIEQDADVIFFSQCPNFSNKNLRTKLESKYSKYKFDSSNYNGIAIYVLSEMNVKFDDFQWDQDEIHPDCICAEIEIGLHKIKLVGLRFKNYKLAEEDFIYQLLNFF